MFGVLLDLSDDDFCDIKLVGTNEYVLTYVPNKRHNYICYHQVRREQTAGTIRAAWIEKEDNKYHIETKSTISTKWTY